MFVFLLGLQENYWEIPQALFVRLMIVKVMYAVYYASVLMKGRGTGHVPARGILVTHEN